MRSRGLIGFVLLMATAFAACKNGNNDPGSEVAAKVGSREITIRLVDSAIRQQLDASGSGTLTPVELASARLSVLDSMIQEEALFQKAQNENLVPDEAKVSQEIQKRKQDAGVTEEQYKAQLEKVGLTEADLGDKVRRELAINALRDREKARVTAPSDAEIEKYFNDNQDQFVAERGAVLSMIVTDPVDNGARDDAIGEALAEQKIRAIYEQLKSGSDFATIAAQRSEDQSSARGGNLGFASEVQLRQTFPTRPELPGRLMSMNPGQYTEPIRDNLSNRWYIFKVNSRRDQTQKLTLEDVRKDIITLMTEQRQQILLAALASVALSESRQQNFLAQRIVENPRSIVELRPSPLLEQAQPAQNQPTPRVEDEGEAKAASDQPEKK